MTITDVADTGKCVVFLSRRSTGTDAAYARSFVTGELTSATNLRLIRQGTGTIVTFEWFVVKFNDGTTIQTGETAVSTSNPTIQRISPVNLSRTWLYFTWRATANGLAQVSPRGWLESSTEIRWFRQTTTGIVHVRWFVIRMPSGTSVRRGYHDSTVTTEYTKDIKITSVALNRTFSFTTNDCTGTGTAFPRPFWIERITSATNLHLERWYTGQTSDHNWQVIELHSSTYDYVLKVNNQVTDALKIRLRFYDQSNIGRLSNCTIYFRNSGGVSGQIYFLNGAYSQQFGNWYDLNGLSTVYIAMTVSATSTGTSYVYAYLEVLVQGTSTYNLMVITFEILRNISEQNYYQDEL